MNSVSKQLAARIAKNKRSERISDELSAILLATYLGGGTSYRKLAKVHGRSVAAVARAIKRAAEAAP